MRFVIVLALLGLAVARPSKKYDGYKVFQIIPENEDQLALLRQWGRSFDFWLEPTHVGRPTHMMVAPQQQYFVRAKLLANGVPHTIHIDDVQKQIDDSFDSIERERAKRPENMVFNYDDFNTFEDYIAELDNLAASCPTGFTCTTEIIGTTYEGNPLKVLRVQKDGAPQPRYSIWYDAQMHAREWLAGATLMKVIDRLIRQYSTDAVSQRFLDSYDWFFLPVMNPDGYLYTWSTERLWRKNRSPQNAGCFGVDLNRNYPYTWSDPGASGFPCDDTFYGPSAGSEFETQAVDAYANAHQAEIIKWINFHTYGQYWLTQWGDCSVPNDHTTHQMPTANAAADAIEATYGSNWLRGNSCQVLYETSGSIIDHMKYTYGFRYAHTPELRGNSFIVAADQIVPSYTEVFNGLVAFLDTMESIGLP